ncbi:MAG: hypothetical protein Q9164_007565, partial [Protoblastenia rupestris]
MALEYDVVIIGAGLQGLSSAKTFLEIDPSLRLVILDSNKTVGGVWAKEKLYPGLFLNNLLGTYEYTDYPMSEAFGVQSNQHIQGIAAYNYLCAYAKHFDLYRLIHFNTKVLVAEKVNYGWKLNVKIASGTNGRVGKSDELITCAKLIVATGLTYISNPINIKGCSSFAVPLISFADYPHYAAQIYADESIKHITVYGASKASYDIVYGMASHGKRVSWVIRASGYGPTYMLPPWLKIGPFNVWLEKLVTTRAFTWLSPCIWGHFDGFGSMRRLLQGTRVGQWILKTGNAKMQTDVLDQSGVLKHQETRKLIPDQGMMWYGSTQAILNYPSDIYAYVRSGQVKVLRKDTLYLSHPNTINFADGSTAQTDALFCSTGWSHIPNIEFRPASLHADLGIPSTQYTHTQTEQWINLDARADTEIVQRLPLLLSSPNKPSEEDRAQPALAEHEKHDLPITSTPWRLFRGIAPPSLPTNDIVFLGMMTTFSGALRAEISSLWAYAYMFDQLDGPIKSLSMPLHKIQTFSERMYDTALYQRYGKWRTPYG